MAPAFISSEIYRATGYSGNHPLAIARVGPVMTIARHLGWFTETTPYLESPQASLDALRRFHAPDYIDALRDAEAAGRVSPDAREVYNIGTMENPVFPGLFQRAATSVGGSILAAKHALAHGLAFHPAGGTHHGMRARANGFCFFNDPVFAILTLLDAGTSRVLYIDLDAHHGDGVEAAFAQDPRVMTISLHEENRWPFSGTLHDRAGGHARNLPVPRALNDSEFDRLIDTAVLPLTRAFRPDAMVLTCGADPLCGDPLSSLALSNGALTDAILRLVPLAPATVVLGGGGYNPWTVARFWTLLWGRLAGHAIPDRLPEEATALLTTLDCDLVEEEDRDPAWFTTLQDPRNDGPVRDRIDDIAAAVLRETTDLQPA
ncbi:MAG: acetoin utilization protein AcuC [Paracoccaceae bacterium]|nr:acetoin utilization protein AcuC [Paracoccaceae bacterium]